MRVCAAAEEEDDEAEGEGGFGGGDGEEEDDEALAGGVEVESGEGDEVDGDALEHDFGAEEHHDHVAAGEEADEADGEEDCAEGEVVVEFDLAHLSPVRERHLNREGAKTRRGFWGVIGFIFLSFLRAFVSLGLWFLFCVGALFDWDLARAEEDGAVGGGVFSGDDDGTDEGDGEEDAGEFEGEGVLGVEVGPRTWTLEGGAWAGSVVEGVALSGFPISRLAAMRGSGMRACWAMVWLLVGKRTWRMVPMRRNATRTLTKGSAARRSYSGAVTAPPVEPWLASMMTKT